MRAKFSAALFATILIGAGPACAAIDLTGRWTFTLDSPFGPLTQCEDVVQSGSVLSTTGCSVGAFDYSGSIDVLSGALTLSAPGGSGCAPTVITATAAPDGLTFSGPFTAEQHACSFGCMCCFCLDASGGITAERLCGNGVLDPGEGCDDGNGSDGDCCSATCQLEAAGSPCPDDGDPCTTNTCDGAGGCGQVPTGCKAAGRSLFTVRNDPTSDDRDALTFKWLQGAETNTAELGRPDEATEYSLCVRAGASAATLAIPAGSNWTASGLSGFRYKDASGSGAPSGARRALLRIGSAGKAKAIVKGKGVHLPDDLVPPLSTPIAVQLVNDTGVCFEAVYDDTNVIKNDDGQLRATK
jgi:cysteine-rich repeat protein